MQHPPCRFLLGEPSKGHLVTWSLERCLGSQQEELLAGGRQHYDGGLDERSAGRRLDVEARQFEAYAVRADGRLEPLRADPNVQRSGRRHICADL